MALPSGLTTITVSGTYMDSSGTPQQGSVSFTPSGTIMDPAGHTVLTATAVTAVLSSSGAFSVVLPCTDNAGLTPLGWSYSVTVSVPGAQETFTCWLPSALGATADISALAPVPGTPAPGGIEYFPDTSTPPSAAPSLGGGFLYAEAGALYWLGSSGTRTLIASS